MRFAIVAPPLYRSFVGADAVVRVAGFWVGFGLGLVPGARGAASPHALIGAAIAMAVGPGVAWLPEVAWAFASGLPVVVAFTVWRDRPAPCPV